jgi:hypothetical protein
MARPPVLPAVARPRAAKVAAAVVDAVARRRNLPVPWRKLRMVIPTLVVFGTSPTHRLWESKGLTLPLVVVDAVAAAAVAELRAAELLAVGVVATWRQSLLAAVALPVAAVLLVADEPAAVVADGLSILRTAKSRTLPRREQSSRTFSQIIWRMNRS